MYNTVTAVPRYVIASLTPNTTQAYFQLKAYEFRNMSGSHPVIEQCRHYSATAEIIDCAIPYQRCI